MAREASLRYKRRLGSAKSADSSLVLAAMGAVPDGSEYKVIGGDHVYGF